MSEPSVGSPRLHLRRVDSTNARARELAADRVGLLGTRGVMEDDFYRERLASRWGIQTVVPEAADRDLVDRVIFDELTLGRVEPASRVDYQRIIGQLAERGAQAVVLACTEIGLLIGPGDSVLPLIDSAWVHAMAGVDLAVTSRIGT